MISHFWKNRNILLESFYVIIFYNVVLNKWLSTDVHVDTNIEKDF